MKGCEETMNLKKKTGVIAMLICMAAILAVAWYCLFSVGRRSAHLDGTFVRAIEISEGAEMAA
ncbi:MAG: hypothetical protein RR785_09410 [Clostridium sp.]